MNKRILVIAPHPDDFFISCAGYIIKNVDCTYDILCVATKQLTPSSDIRLYEEREAVSQLIKYTKNNINLHLFEHGVDTALSDSSGQLISHIQDRVVKNKYDIIFLPYHSDTHQDHLSVNMSVVAACRYQRNLLMYETPSTINFIPTIFSELTEEQVNLKVKLSKIYKSQILGHGDIAEEYNLSLGDYIYAKAISNGSMTRTCKFAEGYIPHRFYI